MSLEASVWADEQRLRPLTPAARCGTVAGSSPTAGWGLTASLKGADAPRFAPDGAFFLMVRRNGVPRGTPFPLSGLSTRCRLTTKFDSFGQALSKEHRP